LPTFTWNVDPVALSFPRDPALMVLAGVGVLLTLWGFAKKRSETGFFGVVLLVAAALLRLLVGDTIEIRYYSLLFVGVFLGGYALLNWQIQRGGGDEQDAGDFIVYGVLGVLVGARLGHVIFYDLDKALKDPAWVFQIWTGGLASHGAVVGLIIAMWLFCKRRGIPFLEGSDRFALSAALGATLVRIGNFFNSEIVGKETDGSWGVRFPRYDRGSDPPLRHPSQLYEVTLGLLVLFALYVADRKWGKEDRPRGALISLFFAVYFPGRFVIEYFKEHQVFDEAASLDMGQYLSIPGALLGLYGLWWSFKHRLPAGWYRADELEPPPEHDELTEEEEEELYEPTRARDRDVDEEFAEKRAAKDTDERPAKRVKKKKKKRKKRRAAAPDQAVAEEALADEAEPKPAPSDDEPESKDPAKD
jgi:prolipoprotein diacylglyceryl transferase